MGKEQSMQNHLYKEFKTSEGILPGYDYVYWDELTTQGLFRFLMKEVDHKSLSEGEDILIKVDSKIPEFMGEHLLDCLIKTKLSRKVFILEDGKTILIQPKKKFKNGGENHV